MRLPDPSLAAKWNLLTRSLRTWRVCLDGVELEVSIIQRLTLFHDVVSRERFLRTAAFGGPLAESSRLLVHPPLVRYDVLVNGRSHTGPAWGAPNPRARERAFRIYGHRGVVRIEPRLAAPPECELFIDEVLIEPTRHPLRRAALAVGSVLGLAVAFACALTRI